MDELREEIQARRSPKRVRVDLEVENPALRAAVERGVRALRAVQEEDGSWKSTPDMGPLGLAFSALTEAWLGSLKYEEGRRYARSLQALQRSDGGFESYPGAGIASLEATAVCRAALRVCGVGDSAVAVRRAEAKIRELGGYELVLERLLSCGEPAAIFCAMVGLIQADALPPISPDMAALPWSERMLDGRLHGGVPTLIYACAAVRERFLKKRLLPSFLRSPARVVARTRLAGYIGQFQNENGSWNGAVDATVFALIALEGVGITLADPMVQRGLDWLETRKTRRADGIAIAVFDGDLWETSMSMLALSACGVGADDDAMRAGKSHLEAHQSRREQPRLHQRTPGAPRTGGWAFQSENEIMPCCDDTGVVLAALAASTSARKVDRAPIERGIAWLRGMQNDSGGFGRHAHGLPDKPRGRPMFVGPKPHLGDLKSLLEAIVHPPAEYGDPATADLVGRVLWGLGECGLTIDDPTVARAVTFLERDACPDGSFWGLRNPAYVAGTAFALLGLARVGVSMKAKVVQRAAAWLVSVQNHDGGFGEENASFTDPSRAGVGASTPALTGIALRALAELVDRKAATPIAKAAGERAAQYLVKAQQEDGTWSGSGYVFTLAPPMFYTWGHERMYYALLGLGRWSEVSRSRARRGKLQ